MVFLILIQFITINLNLKYEIYSGIYLLNSCIPYLIISDDLSR